MLRSSEELLQEAVDVGAAEDGFERSGEALPLLGGERADELAQAFAAGRVEPGDLVLAGRGEADPLDPPVERVLAAYHEAVPDEDVDRAAGGSHRQPELGGELGQRQLVLRV